VPIGIVTTGSACALIGCFEQDRDDSDADAK
jgi:hypothetical protein